MGARTAQTNAKFGGVRQGVELANYSTAAPSERASKQAPNLCAPRDFRFNLAFQAKGAS
jgi:hypothetical protein